MVIANGKPKIPIVFDQDELDIIQALRQIMVAKNTLAYFFGLIDEQMLPKIDP